MQIDMLREKITKINEQKNVKMRHLILFDFIDTSIFAKIVKS